MKIIILLLVAFTATSSSAFLGDVRCTWGPTYWCQSYKQAVECDALEHCKRNVWTDVKDNCSICEMVVAKAKDAIDNKDMQQQVLAILNKICTKEGGFFAGECKALVSQNFPAIVAQLDQLLQNPKQLCTSLGLCTSRSERVFMEKLLRHVLRQQRILGQDNQVCSVCEMAVDKVRAILEDNALQQKIQAALDDMCTKDLAPLAAQCKAAVDKYFPIITSHMEQLLNNSQKVCAALGLCTAKDEKMVIEKLLKHVMQKHSFVSQPIQESCSICEMAIDKFRNVLEDNSIQQDIKSVIEELCTKEFGPLAAACKAAVDQYFPIIISHLDKLVQNSQQVCTSLGLCSPDNKRPFTANLLPPIEILRQVHKQKPVKASPQCVLCEFVMSEVKKLLSKDPTEKEIEAALKMVCSIMPSTIRTNCDNFVQEYTTLIISLLINEDPQQICTLLHLCTGNAAGKRREYMVTKPRHIQVLPKVAPNNEQVCNICISIATVVKNMAADNATEEEVETVLDLVCNYMVPVVSQCKAMLHQYLPQIFKLVADSDPQTVCQTIKLCPSSFAPGCELGASYWCRSPKLARKCNAFHYCKVFVWRR